MHLLVIAAGDSIGFSPSFLDFDSPLHFLQNSVLGALT